MSLLLFINILIQLIYKLIIITHDLLKIFILYYLNLELLFVNLDHIFYSRIFVLNTKKVHIHDFMNLKQLKRKFMSLDLNNLCN